MFKDKDKAETIFGVLFGVIAVVATFAEMIIDGFSLASIVGAIKDIAGTAIVFVLMLVFVNEHKKAPGIRGSIESHMKEIEQAYAPLIRQAIASESSDENKVAKLEKVIRYEIAGNTDALFGKKGINYSAFFDISADKPSEIKFYIRKKFFGVEEGSTFIAEDISKSIELYMKKRYSKLEISFEPDKHGGKIAIGFDKVLDAKKDIEELMEIIDDMAFIFVAIKSSHFCNKE